MNIIETVMDRLTYGGTNDLAVLGLLVVCVLWLISRAPMN